MLSEDDVNVLIARAAEEGLDANETIALVCEAGVPKGLVKKMVRLHPAFHDAQKTKRSFKEALALVKVSSEK